MLDVYYTTEKPLPTEIRAVCRLVMATTESQREAVQIVLEEFFDLTPDGWINYRADEEIDAMRSKQQMQREKANKRWHKPSEDNGNAPGMPRHEESDAAAYATASMNDAEAMPPTPTPTPTPTPQAKRSRSSPAVGTPPDVSGETWADYLALRRAKRAPMTQTALDGLVREAEKAGITLQAVLETCCQRGWTGFKADWLRNSSSQQQRAEKFDPVAHVNRNRTRSGYEQQPGGNVIDITP